MAAKISAVLLAGGESRRMGRDKATFEFCGKALWQNQFALLKKLDPFEIFVSARTNPFWRPDETIFAADEPPSRGPISGIAATFKKMRTGHLIVLAIDLPLMSANYLRLLCAQIAKGRGIVPMIGDRAEPLAAIYPIEAADDFTASLSKKDYSLQSVIKNLAAAKKVRLLPVATEDENLFCNLNSPPN